MLACIFYILVIVALIFRNNFFGLLGDGQLSKTFVVLIFLGKVLAVPVFYGVYKKTYGGIENFDTGKFYHDVRVIQQTAKTEPKVFLRILFGLQNDASGSEDFEKCLKYTVNWDNGTVKDYLYNDNRVLIRTHVLLAFFSFGSFFVQSLFSCLMSFIGIFFLFRSFKTLFPGREKWVLMVLCFYPALWFYTGALLKEGLCLLLMGVITYGLQSVFSIAKNLKTVLVLIPALILALLLKPYLLFTYAAFLSLYFFLRRFSSFRKQFLYFYGIMILLIFVANFLSQKIKHRSLVAAVIEHQHRFEAVSRGGLFLSDSLDYVQLAPDSSLVERSTTRLGMYHIKKGVNFMYWRADQPRDTLYCINNADTIKNYGFIYFIAPSRSNIHLSVGSPAAVVGSAFYYSLFYPLFFNARGVLQYLASLENLILIISFLIIGFHALYYRKIDLFSLVFITFALSICLLVGVSAPNSGAIFRYRAPAVIFILLIALNRLRDLRRVMFSNNKPVESSLIL